MHGPARPGPARPYDDDASRPVEEAIRRSVVDHAEEWFPGTGRSPAVELRKLVERPRAVLYAVHVGDGSAAPRVLAKVRRPWPAGDGAQPAGARPRPATGTLPVSEMTALEYAGLERIHAMVDGPDPVFAPVRPLDHLAAQATLLMEYVDAATLRQLLVRQSRLSVQRWLPGGRREPGHVWRHAGVWLSSFHDRMPGQGLPARQATRQEVVDLFRAYDDFLTSRLGSPGTGNAARRGAELAAEVLPERLPMAVGHGDFAPRNVFLRRDGRLAVFDPMPRWTAPRLEDLSRFLVAMRLQGLQVHTRGAAFGPGELDRREQDVVDGYFGDERPRLAELRCYQLLITLDKWSALVDAPAGGLRGRLRGASLRLASGVLRAETERLLAAGSSPPG